MGKPTKKLIIEALAMLKDSVIFWLMHYMVKDKIEKRKKEQWEINDYYGKKNRRTLIIIPWSASLIGDFIFFFLDYYIMQKAWAYCLILDRRRLTLI